MEKYNRLTVVGSAGKRGFHEMWMCQCECGTVKSIRASAVRSGRTKSCGCLVGETNIKNKTKHGRSRSIEHKTWGGIIQRCTNPKSPNFDIYGGRGIGVCDRWRNSFSDFFSDMGPRPSPLHSIDRIDNDGDYRPENCRWATMSEQHRNYSQNALVEFNGKTQSVTEWSEENGIPFSALYKRLYELGWEIERAMITPVRHVKKWPKHS